MIISDYTITYNVFVFCRAGAQTQGLAYDNPVLHHRGAALA